MDISKLKPNDHVWALLDKKLVVAIFKSVITTHDKSGNYFLLAGDWEGRIDPKDITLIQIIEKPNDYVLTPTYY